MGWWNGWAAKPPTRGIGFAIGEDRLILSLQEAGKGGTPQSRDIFVAWMGERAPLRSWRHRSCGPVLRELPGRAEIRQGAGAGGQTRERGMRGSGDDEIATGQWTSEDVGGWLAGQNERGTVFGDGGEVKVVIRPIRWR